MKILHNNTEILDIQVDDNSYRYRAIKGDNNLTLYFSLAEHVEIPIGAYCVYQAETYTLEKSENLKMKHSRNFEYTVIFDSPQAKAQMFKFRNPVDGRLKFSLTAKPIEHLQMFVDNMNQRDSGWTVGQCIDAPEITLSYNHVFCNEALTQMADELETEYEFIGKQVSLRKVEYNKDNPLPLSYGRGNGLKPGIGRSNYEDKIPIEVLYTQGSDRNIDASKYGSSELLLPKSQQIRFDGVHFEDETGFDSTKAREYVTDTNGYSVRRDDKTLSSFAEDSLDCSEIYPSRVGTVSDVVTVNADKNFYDIVDSGIPENLNFEDYLIAGETMTIIFQTGMLAGRELDVKYYHSAISGKQARRFEIVPQEEDGETMPNETFIPAVGDKYAIFNCMLPDAYICDNDTKSGASWEMLRKAVRYLYDNEDQKFSFTGELDGIWAKKDWINIGGKLKLGGYVQFSDERFQPEGVLVRIVGIKDYINNPHSPEIELSNSTIGQGVSSALRQIDANEVVMGELHNNSIQFTKRRYRDTKETIDMLNEAMLSNFTEAISPISVQTMIALIGDESLQFRFVDSTTSPSEVSENITYNSSTKELTVSAGILQHLTLGIDSVKPVHNASEYKFWTIPEFTSAVLDDESKRYYLYAKVSRSDGTGVFILSETAISLEGVSGYYHLWMGVLNSEYDGDRSYVSMYGYTEITPGRITANKYVSTDGETFIDLLNGIIQGKITFKSGSTGYANITDKPDLSVYALQNYVDSVTADLQSQIDGNITSWFYAYVPTLANEPASTWTTDTEKDKHLGDLFYDTSTGYAYRFQKVNSVYSWQQLSDSDIAAALAAAATAQDTADGKRRVFTSQPTSAEGYDVGDLWANATYGTTYTNDLLKCKTAKAAGAAFSISHWEKASKYTDDTAVDELQIGGRNLLKNSEYISSIGYWINQSMYNLVMVESDIRFIRVTYGWDAVQLISLDAGTYTITLLGRVYSGTGRIRLLLVDVDNNLNKNIFYPVSTNWNKFSQTITLTKQYVKIYILSENSSTYVDVARIKLESGNRATDWTPAPEDIDAKITTAQDTAESKSRHFIVLPTTPYYVGDTYSDGTALYRCKTQRLTGSYTASDWELATTFDNTQTVIDGGLVTAGTVQVGTGGEGAVTVKAGITGQGTSEDDVRIWAGSSFLNRANAPFNVKQSGEMSAKAGNIAGWEILSDMLRHVDGDYGIEFSAINNMLRFLYQSNEKLSIANQDLPDLSTLKSPANGTNYTGANGTLSFTALGNGTYEASGDYISPTSITVPASLIKVSTRISFNTRIQVNVKCWLANTSNVKISLLAEYNKTSGASTSVNELWVTSLIGVDAGTYKIIYEYYAIGEDYGFKIGSSTSTENYVYYTQSRAATLIARNGIASFWNSSKYFYLSQAASYFMQILGASKIMAGNNGIDITTTAANFVGATRGNIYKKLTVPFNSPTSMPSNCETVILYFSSSSGGDAKLPTHQAIATSLGVTGAFSVRLALICDLNSYNGRFWGKNTSITGMDTTDYPTVISNNGTLDYGSQDVSKGDVYMLQLVYDGTNYYAYTISKRQ